MFTLARLAILTLALGLGVVGCRAQIRATATVSEPELVMVEDDVWVVERYNEPVFYVEGYYWRWYGGVWYRSTVHTGNWVTMTVVPARIQRIQKPEIYVNYVAPANAQKRRGPPDHAPAHGVRGTEPGHAEGGPPGQGGPPGHAGGPPPGHDMEKAMKEERKEEKKEEKREEKAMKEAGKPAKEEKGPPAKEAKPAKEEKGPPGMKKEEPAKKEEKAAKEAPKKEEKAAPTKEAPKKEEKAAPAKEEKKAGPEKGKK